MIPKKIHYVWFGAKPRFVIEAVDSWKRLLPDYEILEWNESNVGSHPWMEKMLKAGKLAFASDWARLHVLHQHGGIYLDTDVELHKRFDPFLGNGMFWGFEYDCYLATCVIGSSPGHHLLRELLALYDNMDDAVINNAVVTRFFLERFPEFRLNNADQVLAGDVHVYGKEYFSVPSFNRNKNYSRHHGSNLWAQPRKVSSFKRMVRGLLGEALYYKLVAYKVCRSNEFYTIYKRHSKAPR